MLYFTFTACTATGSSLGSASGKRVRGSQSSPGSPKCLGPKFGQGQHGIFNWGTVSKATPSKKKKQKTENIRLNNGKLHLRGSKQLFRKLFLPVAIRHCDLIFFLPTLPFYYSVSFFMLTSSFPLEISHLNLFNASPHFSCSCHL